jgi:hypothetical protein
MPGEDRRSPAMPAGWQTMLAALSLVLLAAAGRAVRADSAPAPPDAGASALCEQAVALVERAEAIPRDLLGAIAIAESRRPGTAALPAGPWPWTVGAQGRGLFFDTKSDAIEAVRTLLAGGERNIDVGCLQINLGHHPDAFVDLEEAFDPLANAAYGAAFLKVLFLETGSWPEAISRYHSTAPARSSAYRDKVLELWRGRRGRAVFAGSGDGRSDPGAAVGATGSRAPASAAADGPGRNDVAGKTVDSPNLSAQAIRELRTRLKAMAPR